MPAIGTGYADGSASAVVRRKIAERLHREVSTISREVNLNAGRADGCRPFGVPLDDAAAQAVKSARPALRVLAGAACPTTAGRPAPGPW
jgi:hypothetical protein